MVAAIVAVVFAASQGLFTDGFMTRVVDDSQTASSQTNSPSAPESSDADEAGSPDGDDGNGPDSEQESLVETDGGATPDTDEASAAETDEGRDDAEAALEEEAKSYVEQLSEPSDEPMQMGSAAGFTSPDQTVESREDDAGESAG